MPGVGESGKVFGFIWAFILLEAIKLSGFVLGLYIMRQRCACVCVSAHMRKMCVSGGEIKKTQGKPQELLKKKNTFSTEGKRNSVVLPNATQMRGKVQGKLIFKNK